MNTIENSFVNLFNNEKYSSMTIESKYLYQVLIYRYQLSIKNKNKYSDKKGNIFIFYTIEELKKILNKSKSTIIKLKKELTKFGLLIEKKQGLTKPNLLYPQPVINLNKKKSRLQEVQNLDPIIKDIYKDKKIIENTPYRPNCQEKNKKDIIIFSDDISFHKKTGKLKINSVNMPNSNCDMVNSNCDMVKNVSITQEKNQLKKITDFFRKHFNNVNPHGLKKLLKIPLHKVYQYEEYFSTVPKHYQNAGFFVDAISKNYDLSKPERQKPIQATNYEQRKYNDDFFASLYDNIKIDKYSDLEEVF
jgi:hypothetical protein